MPTTTNYGWTTPADTDLVKDGASAIRTLGTSIDTTTKNLNPSTTLGDIEYRSSTANTNTRLPIGTTGQILTVSGGVPAWGAAPSSGGMTLLSTTALTGAVTSITSISQSYKELVIYIYGVTNATANGTFFCIPYNGSTSLSVSAVGPTGMSGFDVAMGQTVGYRLTTDGSSSQILDRADSRNFWDVRLPNYTSTTNYKGYQVIGGYYANESPIGRITLGAVMSNSAINRIDLQNSGGNLSTGTALIYGVN